MNDLECVKPGTKIMYVCVCYVFVCVVRVCVVRVCVLPHRLLPPMHRVFTVRVFLDFVLAEVVEGCGDHSDSDDILRILSI